MTFSLQEFGNWKRHRASLFNPLIGQIETFNYQSPSRMALLEIIVHFDSLKEAI